MMEPNAYHEAEHWDDDDSDSFRMDVFDGCVPRHESVEGAQKWTSSRRQSLTRQPRS